ncbi:FAD-dependent oxidoreductase [Streptomyces sp. NPDC048182]|uniref:FAD-dependent oxidoreductase n=1 Tax=Streptomyces sp. NPDC048182 TaxID=3365507 RepID=UPI003710ED2A
MHQGRGGLPLARILHVNGIPSAVHEADPSPTSRPQGGMLDIHEHNGRPALAAAGLTDGFRALVLEGRQASRALAPDGGVLLDEPDDGTGARPGVQRGELRRLLLDSLPAGTVRWGHKVTGVRALGEGHHEVAFANGTRVETGLLVGADGAWSRVRPLLSSAKPVYTGTSFIETYLHDADTRHPVAAKAVGGGAMYALAPGKGIQAHREAGGTLHTYVALQKPMAWFEAIDLADPGAVAGVVAREFGDWAGEPTALFTDGGTTPVLRPPHTLPADHRWDRVPGVTLLGDAAHLMIPSGEGANLAMFDAAELGKALAAHPGDTETALAAYERDLFPRSAEEAHEADHLHELMSGPDSPHGLLNLIAPRR